MRSPDANDVQPLGAPVPRPTTKEPPHEQWMPVPGKPGLERDPQGRLRTNTPGEQRALVRFVGDFGKSRWA